MPAPVAATRMPAAPRPTAPLQGETVDAAAPAFRWRPVPGATRYTLQIAADSDGQHVIATLDAGPATELVAFDLLRPRAHPLFWRVRAEGDQGPGPWSLPARFVADTDHAVDAFIAQRDAEQQETRRAERRHQAEEQASRDLIPPHSRPDHLPSDAQIRLLGFLFLCGMLLTGLLILVASRGI